jgi:hypothetical protein
VGKRKCKGQRIITQAYQLEVLGRNPSIDYLDQRVLTFPVNICYNLTIVSRLKVTYIFKNILHAVTDVMNIINLNYTHLCQEFCLEYTPETDESEPPIIRCEINCSGGSGW